MQENINKKKKGKNKNSVQNQFDPCKQAMHKRPVDLRCKIDNFTHQILINNNNGLDVYFHNDKVVT